MFTRNPSLRWSLLLAAAMACTPAAQEPDPQNPDAGDATDPGNGSDAGSAVDAGNPPPPPADAGSPPPVVDAGTPSVDSGSPMDAGSPDAGSPAPDAGPPVVPTNDPSTAGASTFTENEVVVVAVPYVAPVDDDLSDAGDGSDAGDASDAGTVIVDPGFPTLPRVIELTTFVPDGEGPFEPVIIVHGFGLAPVYYKSLAEHLASHGYLATLIDLNASTNPRPSHAEMATYLADAVDWLEDQNADGAALAGLMDMEKLAFVGHSMGGKLSLLLASTDARPQAVFAIDPVDALPPLQMPSSEFPSVTPELMGDIDIPVVYVGETTNAMSAGLGQACAPAADNFQQYYMYSTGPALEIDVKGANHMSFIEPDLLCLACLACSQGTDDPEVTRALTRRWMVAFFDLILRGDDSQRAWLTGAGMQAEVDQQRVTIQTKNGF